MFSVLVVSAKINNLIKFLFKGLSSTFFLPDAGFHSFFALLQVESVFCR